MKTMFAAALAATALATPAIAQQIPDAKIAVVDTDRVFTSSNAWKAAQPQLQTQQTTLRSSLQSLNSSLQSEGQTLQTAVDAAKGNPDAALKARITAFQTKQASAQTQAQTQEQTFQRNVNYARQQILERAVQIAGQIAQQRGATIAVDKNSTIYSATNVEITDAVLTQLNSQLPSVSVTAPAQAAAPATQQRPSGR